MALHKELEEVHKGSVLAVHKGLGEVDLLWWVYWGLVLKQHQLGASSQLMDRSEQNLEGLEGLHHLFPMPSPSRNQQVYLQTQKIIVPKHLPKFEGTQHQDPNKVSFLQPSIYICDIQAICISEFPTGYCMWSCSRYGAEPDSIATYIRAVRAWSRSRVQKAHHFHFGRWTVLWCCQCFLIVIIQPLDMITLTCIPSLGGGKQSTCTE